MENECIVEFDVPVNNADKDYLSYEYDPRDNSLIGKHCNDRDWTKIAECAVDVVKQYPEFKNALRTHKLKRYNEK